MSNNTSMLLQLAQEVNQLTASIVTHLTKVNCAEPDFSISSAEVPSDKEYNGLRDALNDTASDLILLVNGPRHHARKFISSHNDLAAYQVAFEYDLFNAIPEHESAELGVLAKSTGIDEDRLGRMLRLMCTHRMFQEIEGNRFCHTSGSVVFARDKDLKAAGDYTLDEMFKASSETASSIRTKRKSPFQQRHGVSLFEYYNNNPKLGARFASAMKGITRLDRQMNELQQGFPWDSLANTKIVDIGGGSGHISIALARTFPELKVIIQDSNPTMFAKAQHELGELAGRVTFMQHDFFQPQPIQDAGLYLLRQVLHNWSDEDCVKILQALVPALEQCKPQTPLLINDTIIPTPGARSRAEEHGTRQIDMLMLVALGAKQRSEAEFRDLLRRADNRFQIAQVHSDGTMGLLKIHLTACKP